MIEKTEYGFTGSVTDLPQWARDNPEMGMAGALAVTYDKQLLATMERQVTKGLTVDEIDKASDAALFGELVRMFDYNGGNVKVDEKDDGGSILVEKVRSDLVRLFTTTTQHVTGPDLRTTIKKALIYEMMFNEMGRMLDKGQVERWVEAKNVPAYLR